MQIGVFTHPQPLLWLNNVMILRLLSLLKWGVWGVLKTKNFVENVNIKGRVELIGPLVLENFTEY